MKEINLETIAGGVAAELFKHELDRVSANIADINTTAKARRVITLEFVFAPDENREEVKLTINSKSKLTPTKPCARTIHMGKKNNKAALYQSDVNQMDMFDEGVEKMETKKRSTVNA